MNPARLLPLLLPVVFAAHGAHAAPPKLVEPTLHLSERNASGPRVALTLDACDGKIDDRILSALIENGIPATIFVTGKWVAKNPTAISVMLAHPDLFEIENHGLSHRPAVDRKTTIFGVPAAGDLAAVQLEIVGGRDAILDAHGISTRWFRGATARYTPEAIRLARDLGFRIAGYSLNGDAGATASAKEAARRIAHAKDGDVIIAHVNQPNRPAGAGVVQGILGLKALGYTFLRLSDVTESGSDGSTD